MSGTISMAAIGSEGWWQMLQRYKLFRDVLLKLNLAFQVVTALQAKLVYVSGTKPMAAKLMRAGCKCYNVTSHFEMCMVNFNFACEVVTALQAKK